MSKSFRYIEQSTWRCCLDVLCRRPSIPCTVRSQGRGRNKFKGVIEMGWYLRKSFRAGPVRWNLSKSGIGMSVGVRGLRVGTGPRGPYIAGGRNGVYFRQSLRTSQPRGTARRNITPSHMPSYRYSSPVSTPPPMPATGQLYPTAPVQYIADAQLAPYTPATQHALAQHIREQRSHLAVRPWVIAGVCLVNLVTLVVFPLLLLTIPASIFAVIWANQYDEARRQVVLDYDLSTDEAASYEQLCTGFSWLAYAARLLRVDARYLHGDMKHNAGTSASLQMSPVSVVRPNSMVKTNVPVWSVRWQQGNSALTFLPDHILFEQGSMIAVIAYEDVQVETSPGRFVESNMVPRDAHIASYTWQYVNKNGTPDQRYTANRQLPILDVSYVGLVTPGGFQLVLQVSNSHSAEVFVNTFRAFHPLVIQESQVSVTPDQ
jgi:uncharacterized protein DUF4236